MTTSIPDGRIFKKDVTGQIMYSLEALLTEYKRSGMRGRAFAQWAGINYGTLMT